MTNLRLGVDTVLLTVLGFVVAFSVTFRSSTAYERYSEGRRYWSSLILTSRNLGRHVWINMAERVDEEDPPSVCPLPENAVVPELEAYF